jgi:hypothetical protein
LFLYKKLRVLQCYNCGAITKKNIYKVIRQVIVLEVGVEQNVLQYFAPLLILPLKTYKVFSTPLIY